MPEVRDTIDFRRVCDLPRRRFNTRDAAAWAAYLTEELKLPTYIDPKCCDDEHRKCACRGRMALNPEQGMALAEFMACGGAFLGLPVGWGKTLIFYLAAVLCEAMRPALIVPASLQDKTWADFAHLRKHWKAPLTAPRLISRESLAPESGEFLLSGLNPDFVGIDEMDDLQNWESSAVRRIHRFRLANQEALFMGGTGTPGRKSILNYWHLLFWCLGDHAPIPMKRAEARDWAAVLDYRKNARADTRMKPGVLGHDTDSARAWYAARLSETPGVLLVDGDSCDVPLTIRMRLAREDSRLDRAYEHFLTTLETPDGQSVSDPLSQWRIDGQYGCGLYLKWKKPPPAEWRLAYRAKNSFVRTRIADTTNSNRPLDTEGAVLRRHAEHPIVQAWKQADPLFDDRSVVAVWISDSTILSVGDWLAESAEPGVVWTGCVEFGQALAKAMRLPYYGAKGRNEWGAGLHVADPKRSLVASWNANKKGFNLQAWRRQLIVMPPPSAKWLEQIFGRAHRQRQTKAVVVDVLVTSGGTIDAIKAAIGEARFNRTTLRMTQKILRADVKWCDPDITEANAFRWSQKNGA